MTRIIAGTHGGRRLETPRGDGTRPTSDRVREALFSSLESELGGFDGLHVIDLFAGSGALGLEAMSRGAESATFVESDRRAATTIRRNIEALGLSGAVVEAARAETFVQHPHPPPADLVFVDPPYALSTGAVAALVEALHRHTAPDALFVVERATRDPFVWPDAVVGLRSKKYGETTLWYGR